jgi:hypothetical protein
MGIGMRTRKGPDLPDAGMDRIAPEGTAEDQQVGMRRRATCYGRRIGREYKESTDQ